MTEHGKYLPVATFTDCIRSCLTLMNSTNVYLTPFDCYRPPEVLERMRRCLRTGGMVAMSTRDHPETLPDGVFHTADDWHALVRARPALAVLDNLIFDDPRGREFRRWSDGGHDGEDTYGTETVDFLAAAIAGLTEAGTEELLLVSEEARISDGWRDWMTRRGFVVLQDGGDLEAVRCRRWRLSESAADGRVGYRYPEGRLLRRADSASPRIFEARVVSPQAEALLATVAEYAALYHEYDNPDDPRRLNMRQDCFDGIVRASGDPRSILTDLENLYDLVSGHVDFAAPYRESRISRIRSLLVDEAAQAFAGEEVARLCDRLEQVELRAFEAESRSREGDR